MKTKLLTLAILCATCLQLQAQIEKGNTFVGGSISFGTSKQTENSSRLNTFTLSPRIGYFLGHGFALGAEIPLNLSKLRGANYIYWDEQDWQYRDTFGPKEFSFGISPFARKYVDINNRIKFFGQANLLMQINTFNLIDNEGYLIRTRTRIKGFGASISPGFAYFITKSSNIEFSVPMVRFFHQRYYDQDSMYNFDQTNNVDLALDNFTPTLGFNFHF